MYTDEIFNQPNSRVKLHSLSNLLLLTPRNHRVGLIYLLYHTCCLHALAEVFIILDIWPIFFFVVISRAIS